MTLDLPILVLGDHLQREFAAPLAWLDERLRVVRVNTIAEAAAQLSQEYCGGQVVALARPGRFTANQIEELHALAPLAPVVALAGAWCDGETRSGFPWQGVPRIAWHAWRGAFEQLWGTQRQKRSLWLPRLATDLDRLAAQLPLSKPAVGATVVVHSQDPGLREVLVNSLGTHGWQVLNLNESQPKEAPVMCVWDWNPWQRDEDARLANARRLLSPTKFIVLRDFVRPEMADELLAAGVCAVLGKPWLLPDLIAAMNEVVAEARVRLPGSS